MWEQVRDATGLFFWPQLVLSIAVTALVAGYGAALLRGELRGADAPWRRTLDPLAGIAVSVGLLGSVYSFARAFQGFEGQLDVAAIASRLGMAYSTTAFGLVTSIIAALGSYVLSVLTRERVPAAAEA